MVLAVERVSSELELRDSWEMYQRTLLVENRLGLTTITALLAIITTLSLGEQRGLAGLVLRNLVLGVLAASLALAKGLACLRDVDLCDIRHQPKPDNSTHLQLYSCSLSREELIWLCWSVKLDIATR